MSDLIVRDAGQIRSNRYGIKQVLVTIVCDFGHETPWQFDAYLATGGNAYCNECDGHDGTWRGITFNAYDDSIHEVLR